MGEQISAVQDEFRFHSPAAKDGILMIRALEDEALLAAARDNASSEHAELMAALGTATNPTWVTSSCAETAYDRGLIDGQELDWLCK